MLRRLAALTLTAACATVAAADRPAEKPVARPAADRLAADRPTAAQAMQAAQAWLDALDGDKATAAAPHTASSLFGVAYGLTGKPCAETTATSPAAVGKLLACLQEEVSATSDLKPWKQGGPAGFGPLLKMQRRKITALERTSTLVYMHEKCVGEGRDVIIAVALEKGKPKVSAALSSHWSCGE
jgi:hypothetical protein